MKLKVAIAIVRGYKEKLKSQMKNRMPLVPNISASNDDDEEEEY